MSQKTAIITGGSSGIGLAVAQALAARGNWSLHLIGTNDERGEEAVASLGPCAKFYKVDISNYSAVAGVFDTVSKSDQGRLDFVFANAGGIERFDFYAKLNSEDGKGGPPPEPDHSVLDINLKGVLYTAYLALYYFRQAPSYPEKDANLILTSSVAGIYCSTAAPMYTASKYGVLGLMRSINASFYSNDNIRVNCICPNATRTNIAGDYSVWDHLRPDQMTSLPYIVDIVTKLIDGAEFADSRGTRTSGPDSRGYAVEISGTNCYIREPYEFADGLARELMDPESMKESFDKAKEMERN